MATRSKFEGIDCAELTPERWNPDRTEIGHGFRCARREFTTYFKQGRVRREVNAHISRCWVLVHEGSLVAYITLLADKLTGEEDLLGTEGIRYTTFPSVKIGLLAVDERTKGAGAALILWALRHVALEVQGSVGVRFVTVDALYDKDAIGTDGKRYDVSPFYTKLGFRYPQPDEPLPPEQPFRTLYFDLRPLIEQLHDLDTSSD